jgi:REP element-mobilizing transposase RayT
VTWFLTFRTYGSYHPDGDKLIQWRRQHLGFSQSELSAPARTQVLDSIRRVCDTHGWQLLAAHVRNTHVHVVVTGDIEPSLMIGAFKAHAGRALRSAGEVRAKTRIWALGGYSCWLKDAEGVRNAVRYVLDHQGAPMALYAAAPI